MGGLAALGAGWIKEGKRSAGGGLVYPRGKRRNAGERAGAGWGVALPRPLVGGANLPTFRFFDLSGCWRVGGSWRCCRASARRRNAGRAGGGEKKVQGTGERAPGRRRGRREEVRARRMQGGALTGGSAAGAGGLPADREKREAASTGWGRGCGGCDSSLQ